MDAEKISVRRLRATDREAWAPLWQGYLDFYREQIAPEVTDETFRRLCEAANGMLGLVAVDGSDRAIGIAHLVFHASTWAREPSCYLEDLFVDRAARGARAADRLFEAIYATAREHGASKVYWMTQEFNAPARSLYDTVGRLQSFVIYEHELEQQ